MSFDNIKLEKGLYTTGKSFTQALEAIDPSENYKGTSLEGLDAYERQLKRFDIKVSGPNSDSISKFYKTSDSAVLFPEYISRAVRTGIERNNAVEKIIATVTEIDALDYRSIKLNDSMDCSLKEVVEGTLFSECYISLKDDHTKLKKYGKILTGSYEAIKYQKLDLFSIVLKRIGEGISNSQFLSAIEAISENEKCQQYRGEIMNITYEDLVDIWTMCHPFNMNTIIASKNVFSKILKLPEMRDASAGLDFHGTGRIVTPFGAELICPSNVDNDFIFGIDRNNTLEMVRAGGVCTEFDKLIDCQMERAAISTIVGFSPIYGEAAVFGIAA